MEQLPQSTLFPYTTLFRSILEHQEFDAGEFQMTARQLLVDHELRTRDVELPVGDEDRKSARLNYSHRRRRNDVAELQNVTCGVREHRIAEGFRGLSNRLHQ